MLQYIYVKGMCLAIFIFGVVELSYFPSEGSLILGITIDIEGKQLKVQLIVFGTVVQVAFGKHNWNMQEFNVKKII